MSSFDNFIRLVQTEALFACMTRPGHSIRPAAILSVALQCPVQCLAPTTEAQRFQAEELVDWFFGGPDPEWLPEQLMFEEVEELIEEYVETEDLEEEDFEYEYVEEFVDGEDY